MKWLILILLGTVITGSVSAQSRAFRDRTPLFGGTATVIVYANTRAEASPSIDSALAEIRRVEELFAQSPLFAGPLPASVIPGSELGRVLNRALGWASSSSGAFDPTEGALLAVWARYDSLDALPSDVEIAEAQTRVGWRGLQFDLLSSELRSDRGGLELSKRVLGPAYALDAAAAILSADLPALISWSGGLYRALAPPPGQTGWRVNIADPTEAGEFDSAVSLQSGAVSIAPVGNDPLIDPRTGMPANSTTQAAVLASSALDAGMLSNALMVLGPDQSETLLAGQPEVQARLVFPVTTGHRILALRWPAPGQFP